MVVEQMARHKRVSITCSQRIFETRCVNKKRIGWKIRDLTVIITFQFSIYVAKSYILLRCVVVLDMFKKFSGPGFMEVSKIYLF